MQLPKIYRYCWAYCVHASTSCLVPNRNGKNNDGKNNGVNTITSTERFIQVHKTLDMTYT